MIRMALIMLLRVQSPTISGGSPWREMGPRRAISLLDSAELGARSLTSPVRQLKF